MVFPQTLSEDILCSHKLTSSFSEVFVVDLALDIGLGIFSFGLIFLRGGGWGGVAFFDSRLRDSCVLALSWLQLRPLDNPFFIKPSFSSHDGFIIYYSSHFNTGIYLFMLLIIQSKVFLNFPLALSYMSYLDNILYLFPRMCVLSLLILI